MSSSALTMVCSALETPSAVALACFAVSASASLATSRPFSSVLVDLAVFSDAADTFSSSAHAASNFCDILTVSLAVSLNAFTNLVALASYSTVIF